MAASADAPKRIVIRANRETLALVAAACGFALLVAYGKNHEAPPRPAEVASTATPAPRDWTGQLADVPSAASTVAPPSEPLSSSSLTVPKAQLALPPTPIKPRQRPCEPGAPCVARTAVASAPPAAATPAVPVRRPSPVVRVAESDAHPPAPEHSLMSTLNPLNHLPDMASVKRPFSYAGETVVGWFKR